jgi:hypothetical protein
MSLKSYRQVVYPEQPSIQEVFNQTIQEMMADGLSEDEMAKVVDNEMVPAIAKDFAKVHQSSVYPPADALLEYCLSEGISESLYDAIANYIAEATINDDDNVETDWTKLSPEQHIAAVKKFLKRLAGYKDSSKPFLNTSQTVSPSRRPADRKWNDDDEQPNNKLRLSKVPVVSEATNTDDSHKSHPLHSLLKSHGFEHYRSYPIKQPNATITNYHIWVNKFSNLVGSYDGEHKWTSKINKNSGHSATGDTKTELDAHLKNRAVRNKRLPEQHSLPSNPLQEGLQDPYGNEKVKKYSEWMSRNPFRSLDHDLSTNDAASRKNDLIDAWRLRAQQDRTYGFDEDIDYKAASLAQLNERKKK